MVGKKTKNSSPGLTQWAKPEQLSPSVRILYKQMSSETFSSQHLSHNGLKRGDTFWAKCTFAHLFERMPCDSVTTGPGCYPASCWDRPGVGNTNNITSTPMMMKFHGKKKISTLGSEMSKSQRHLVVKLTLILTTHISRIMWVNVKPPSQMMYDGPFQQTDLGCSSFPARLSEY